MSYSKDKKIQSIIEKGKVLADKDASRPSFHAKPISQRMGDPNGVIFYKGKYHLFYQFNPLSSGRGKTNWGHMSSKNLIDWTYHKIAFAPDEKKGEERCFSGSSIATKEGVFVAYTSVMNHRQGIYTQGFAISKDKDLNNWKNYPSALFEKPLVKGYDAGQRWRDPYIFKDGKKTFMTVGCSLEKDGQRYTSPLLYKAKDSTFKNWEYVGMLREFSNADFPNATNLFLECPNFIKIGKKWVLFGSPESSVKYFVGSFDSEKGEFKEDNSGFVSYAKKSYFYATYVMYDEKKKRHLMFASSFGKDDDLQNSWHGVQALPREISIKKNSLVQKPIRELKKLRERKIRFTKTVDLDKPCFEISTNILPNLKGQIILKGATDLLIDFGLRKLKIGTEEMPLNLTKKAKVQIFFDRSLCEIFVNNNQAVSYSQRDLNITSLEVKGDIFRKLKLWQLRDAIFNID